MYNLCAMMTEIYTIEGGKKDVSSPEGTTLKKILGAYLSLFLHLVSSKYSIQKTDDLIMTHKGGKHILQRGKVF